MKKWQEKIIDDHWVQRVIDHDTGKDITGEKETEVSLSTGNTL